MDHSNQTGPQAVGFFLNIILTFIIINNSRKEMGLYKYLLAIFCIYDAVYAFIHFMIRPIMFTYKDGFCLFPGGIVSKYFENRILISVWACAHSFSFVMLAYHFIYRYLAIKSPNRLRFFESKTGLIVMISVGIFVPGSWFCSTYFGPEDSPRTDAYFQPYFQSQFGINASDVPYMASMYFYPDENGILQLQPPAFFGLGTSILYSGVAYVIIGFCGWQTYVHMNRCSSSALSIRLQRQLFKSLVIQATIPTLLAVIPCVWGVGLPLLPVSTPWVVHVFLPAMSTFPIFDACSIIYFIGDYRRVISFLLRARYTENSDVIIHRTSIATY